MPRHNATIRNLVVLSPTTFRVDFDVLSGEDRIASIACGAAVDGHDYVMVVDPTGEAREFSFDFGVLEKTIASDSTINVVLKIIDHDGEMWEGCFSKMLAMEGGKCFIDGMSISQRNDGSMLIDVFYDIVSPSEVDPALVVFSVSGDGGETYAVPTASATGDLGADVPTGPRRHIIWDPKTDYLAGAGKAIRAKVYAYSYRTEAYYSAESGSIVLASPSVAPTLSLVSGSEKERYGVGEGELFKDLSVKFGAIESSSSSSETSASSQT